MWNWVRSKRLTRKRLWGVVSVGVSLALLLTLIGVNVQFGAPNEAEHPGFNMGMGSMQVRITIGPPAAYGAPAPDYTADGVADDVQFQAALDALPATGGQLFILAGTYTWTAATTVSRAIDNVTFEGTGRSTILNGDAATALFSAGAQSNWVFRNFVTDAGGITVAGATDYVFENLLLGAIYYGYYFAGDVTLNPGVDLVVDSDIRSANAIDLQPSGDMDDYLSLLTVGNLPLITGIGSYVSVGSAAATGHGLGVADVLFGGDVEVDGTLWADGPITQADGQLLTARTGRSSTLIVASDDASAVSKAQADYVADGVDDQVEIQAAIDALPDTAPNDSGGLVRLVGNNFVTSATITLDVQNLVLEGDGRTATRITGVNGSNHDLLTITAHHVQVAQLKLNGNRNNRAAGRGIYIDQVQFTYIHDVHIQWSPGYSIGTNAVDTVGEVVGLWIDNVLIGQGVADAINLVTWVSDTFIDHSVIGTDTGRGIRAFNPLGLWINEGYFETQDVPIVLEKNADDSDHYGSVFITDSHFLGSPGGIYAQIINDNEVMRNVVITGNSFFAATGDPISLVANGTGRVFEDWIIANNSFYGSTARHIRIIGAEVNYKAWIVEGNTFEQDTSGVFYFNTAGTDNSFQIFGNQGYIHNGEARSKSGVLTAGVAGTIGFAWHNPEIQDILVRKVVIEVTTSGGTVGSHLDVGIADDAVGTARGIEFFDDLLLNNTGIYDSWVGGDGGTQVKWVFAQDTASGTDAWIVGEILDANASSVVGRWYIEYVGR